MSSSAFSSVEFEFEPGLDAGELEAADVRIDLRGRILNRARRARCIRTLTFILALTGRGDRKSRDSSLRSRMTQETTLGEGKKSEPKLRKGPHFWERTRALGAGEDVRIVLDASALTRRSRTHVDLSRRGGKKGSGILPLRLRSGLRRWKRSYSEAL